MVDAQEFTDLMAALVRAIRLTTDFLAGKKLQAGFSIVSLSYNSPLTALLEADPAVTDEQVSDATGYAGEIIAKVERGEDVPAGTPPHLIRAYRQAAAASKRSRLVASVHSRNARMFVRPRAAARFELAFAESVDVDGTFEGMLQMISTRGRPSIRVWPNTGPPVSGKLPRRLVEKAKAAVDSTVVVTGTLIYPPNSLHPRRIRVRDIEEVASEALDPTFDDLWGVGKNHRPEVSSLQLIEEMRSGWD